MKKIIKEIIEHNIDKKEQREFLRNYIKRELENDSRTQRILLNIIKEATKGKRTSFQKSR